MIHEGLGIIWKRIVALKYLMVLTIGFNVLAAVSGVVCSVLMWNGTFQLSEKVVSLSEKQNRISDVLSLSRGLSNSSITNKMTREEAFKEMQSWERLRLETLAINLNSASTYPNDYFTNAARAQAWLEKLNAEASALLVEYRTEIMTLAQRERVLTTAVMWIAAATLIFGVAVPLILLSLMLRALRMAQKSLTNAAKDIVKNWSTALNRYGEDPFRNGHFWIEALLIITEQIGAQSRHPAAMLSAELSHLVREELQRNRTPAA